MAVRTRFSSRSPWLCQLVAIAMLLFAVPLSSVHADKGDETRQARVGEMLILRLPGNREGGFRWRIDREKSDGLENVEVKPIGWMTKPNSQKSLFFRELPVMSISVLPKSAGKAKIALEYYRIYHTRPNFQPRTKFVRLHIKAR